MSSQEGDGERPPVYPEPVSQFTPAGTTATPATPSGSTAAPGPEAGRCEYCDQPLPRGGSEGASRPTFARPRHVYAIGRIEPRFPTLAVEKEFEQLAGESGSRALEDRAVLSDVLSRTENSYLAPLLCWVFVCQGIDSFMVASETRGEASDLVAALAASGPEDQVDVVVGSVVGTPPHHPCAGVSLPWVKPAQFLSFSRQEFLASIPSPADEVDDKAEVETEAFRASARHVFAQVVGRTTNTGFGAESRALNYLALRYPAFYRTVFESSENSMPLRRIEVKPGPVGGRDVMEIQLIFRSRRTDVVERYRCRVDTTELFPFLVSPFEQVFE